LKIFSGDELWVNIFYAGELVCCSLFIESLMITLKILFTGGSDQNRSKKRSGNFSYLFDDPITLLIKENIMKKRYGSSGESVNRINADRLKLLKKSPERLTEPQTLSTANQRG